MQEQMIKAYLNLGDLVQATAERVKDEERGQTAAEYVGIIVVVAAIVLAISQLKIGDTLGGFITKAITSLGGGGAGK
jgi:pilus assembly protein Flp/PilA